MEQQADDAVAGEPERAATPTAPEPEPPVLDPAAAVESAPVRPVPSPTNPGPRRRDRHGRGPRGPLAPPSSPLTVPRAERFGDIVVAAVNRLEPRWGPRLTAVDVEIRDIPDPEALREPGEIPLAAHRSARGQRTATVVVYRRPVELRAPDHQGRVDLVRDLVAEQLAELLGVSPGELDPAYDDDAED